MIAKLTRTAVLLAMFAAASFCMAADDEDLGGAPAKAAKPAAKKPAGAAKPEAKPADAMPAIKFEDPAVEAVLATKSTTPAGWVRSGKILVDLKRPDLARTFFRRVLDANLDDQQLAALAEQYGSGLFVELSGRQDLAPEGTRLAEAVLSARTKLASDTKRLAAAIQDLQNPSPEVRSQALLRLQAARRAAVPPLVAALIDPKRETERPAVRSALLLLAGDAVRPLLAVLESGDPQAMVEAIRTLVQLGAKDASLQLVAPMFSEQGGGEVRKAAEAALRQFVGAVPGRSEGAGLLASEAERYFDRAKQVHADEAGQATLWFWDGASKQIVSRSIPVEHAARILAARFARDAYAVMPGDSRIRSLNLATQLEQAAYENGLDKPLSLEKDTPGGKALQLDAKVIEEVLVYAMAHGRAAAATVAARILGQKPDAEALLHRGAGPSPLAQAARHPDRRLRAAAVEAIVRMQPSEPFAGASHIPESLRFFAATTGARRVLVGSPWSEESRRLGGLLARLGFQTDIAVFGRELIRMGQESPDYELIFVDAAIDQPTAEFLLQQLRRESRTGALPVGLFARQDLLARAEQVVDDDPLAEAFPRPHDEHAMRWQVERLMLRAGGDPVTLAERQRQAAQALDWLAELLASPGQSRLYDWSEMDKAVLVALSVNELSGKAATVLGLLGTAESQQALVELASRTTAPLPLRKAAVEALVQAIQRRGILLTTDQIQRQYDRYNQSVQQPAETQQVLGRILDVLELPRNAAKPAASPPAPAKESPKKPEGKSS